MAFQRLGRKLEDAIAAYIDALKGPFLSGVDIVTPKQTDPVDAPWISIFSGSETPYSDSDRRGSMRGEKRVVLRISIAEHMKDSLLDQYCGEFENLISNARRIGKVNAGTTASTSFVINYAVPNVSPSYLTAGDILSIAGVNRTVASASAGSGTLYNVTLTEAATLTANTPVFLSSVANRGEEYGDIIAEIGSPNGTYKPATGLYVSRIALVTTAPNIDGDLRMQEYEFEVDALNCDDLT